MEALLAAATQDDDLHKELLAAIARPTFNIASFVKKICHSSSNSNSVANLNSTVSPTAPLNVDLNGAGPLPVPGSVCNDCASASHSVAAAPSPNPKPLSAIKKGANFAIELHQWIALQSETFFIKHVADDNITAIAVQPKPVKKRIVLNVDPPLTSPVVLSPMPTSRDLLRRVHKLSALYCAVVNCQHLPTQAAMVLLCKLSSLPWMRDNLPGGTIPQNQQLSNAVLINLSCVAQFVIDCTEAMLPLIKKLGPQFSFGFAACPPISLCCSESSTLVHALTSLADEALFPQGGRLSHAEFIAMNYSGPFMKPFRQDTDSRLEYISQVKVLLWYVGWLLSLHNVLGGDCNLQRARKTLRCV
jgi:hypothetical protein